MSYNSTIKPLWTNLATEEYWQYRGVATKEYPYLEQAVPPEYLPHYILAEDGKYLITEDNEYLILERREING